MNAVLFPLLSIGIYALVRILMTIGPRLGYQNQQRASAGVVNLILVGVLLFMLILQLTTTAIALGVPVDLPFVICLSISVLFIFLGNYMGKLRRNFWAGIRTPWTLTSDVVWERTHRLGGWLFVLTVGCDYELCAGVAPLGTDGRVTHRSSGAGCLLLQFSVANVCMHPLTRNFVVAVSSVGASRPEPFRSYPASAAKLTPSSEPIPEAT